MKKTLRLVFSAVLITALVLSTFVFSHAVSVGTADDFLAAITAGESEITITSDFNLTSKVTVTESVKINGGNHTITCTGQSGEYFVFGGGATYEFNGGTFTTTGGDPIYANGSFTGTIKLTNGAKFICNAPINFSSSAAGTFILDGGIVEASKNAIKNQGSTTVQLLSGTVSTSSTTNAVVTTTGGTKGTLTVGKSDGTGPTITRTNPDSTGELIYLNAGVENLTHNFYGGNIINPGSGAAIYMGISSVINIDAGTFVAGGEGKHNLINRKSSSNVLNITINGGDFTAKDGCFIEQNATDLNLAINGGTFNIDPTAYVDVAKYVVAKSGDKWNVTKKKIFAITFDAQGGTCDTASVDTKDNGKLEALPKAQKTGFVFAGWYDAIEGGNKITTDTVFNLPTTIYARWEDAGTIVTNQDELVAAIGSAKPVITIANDFNLTSKLTINAPVKINGGDYTVTCTGQSGEYFVFGGDATYEFNGGTFTTTGGDPIYANSNFTGTIKLTNGAKFICNAPINFSSSAAGTFILDGGIVEASKNAIKNQGSTTVQLLSGTVSTSATGNAVITTTGGTKGTLTVGKPDGTGPTITRNNAEGTGELVYLNAGVENLNHTIYGGNFINQGTGAALYFGRGSNVTINGGTFVGGGQHYLINMKDNTGPYTITLNGGDYTANGGLFFNSTAAENTFEIKGGTYNVDPTAYIDAAKYVANENGGKWTVGKNPSALLEITFDAQGGSCAAATVNTDENGKLEEIQQAQKVGFIFDGWYDAQTGGNKITTDTVFEFDTTVYARWIECDHSDSDVKPNCQENKTCTICNALMPLTHDFVWHQNSEQTQHWCACEVCGKADEQGNDPVLENHTTDGGSVATCIDSAVCGICQLTFGATNPAVHAETEPYSYKDNKDGATHVKIHNCNNTLADAKEKHTYDTDGYCECGAYKAYAFKNVEDTKQIVTYGKDITFTSVAEFSKFVAVKVNGNILTKNTDYTVTEGSTKVTLKADFVKTLTVGTHKIEIISTDGTATTTFGLEIPEEQAPSQGGTTTPDAGTTAPSTGNSGTTTTPDAGTTTPDAGSTGTNTGSNNVGTSDKTGDFTNILLLAALLVVSSLGITTATFYSKAKKVK